MKAHFFIVLVLSFISTTISAQFKNIQQLKEEDKTDMNLYFYPSTLRMMNFEQDTAFNKLIKGIQKLSFHKMNPEVFDEASFAALKETIQQEEGYEEYMTVEKNGIAGQGIQILGNEAGDEWVAMGFLNGQTYLIALKGTINWLQAPKVYQTLLEQSENTESGFGLLLNFMREEEQQRKRWRERKKVEEASDKKESFQVTIEG